MALRSWAFSFVLGACVAPAAIHCSQANAPPPAASGTDASSGAPPGDDAADPEAAPGLHEPRCQALCTKLTMAQCTTEAECEASCDAEVAGLATYCRRYWNEFFACATGPGVVNGCASGKPVVKGCEQQVLLLAACKQTDAAAPGTCDQYTDKVSSPGCLYCVKHGCCPQAAACTPGTLCDQYLSCLDGCPNADTTCRQQCAVDHGLGVPEGKAFIDCAQTVCFNQCR
jgi:hypothetical protein